MILGAHPSAQQSSPDDQLHCEAFVQLGVSCSPTSHCKDTLSVAKRTKACLSATRPWRLRRVTWPGRLVDGERAPRRYVSRKLLPPRHSSACVRGWSRIEFGLVCCWSSFSVM